MILSCKLAATGLPINLPKTNAIRAGRTQIRALAQDYEPYEKLEAIVELLLDAVPARYRARDESFKATINIGIGALDLADEHSKTGIRIIILPENAADDIFRHWQANRFLVPVQPEPDLAQPSDKTWFRFGSLLGPLVVWSTA